MNSRGKFEIDRVNGKWLGVCAGLANQTGIDATIFRIGFVVASLIGALPWTLIAYVVAYFVGKPQRRAGYATAPRSVTRDEARERMRSLDLRMQAIETYVTSSNSRLAREIEDLR